jgi:hypothetical protein
MTLAHRDDANMVAVAPPTAGATVVLEFPCNLAASPPDLLPDWAVFVVVALVLEAVLSVTGSGFAEGSSCLYLSLSLKGVSCFPWRSVLVDPVADSGSASQSSSELFELVLFSPELVVEFVTIDAFPAVAVVGGAKVVELGAEFVTTKHAKTTKTPTKTETFLNSIFEINGLLCFEQFNPRDKKREIILHF